MLRGVLWGVPTPSRADPSRLIQMPTAAVAISGRLLADVRRFPSGCSGLLELDRIEASRVEGRTELQLPDCPAPLQGWRVQATGILRPKTCWPAGKRWPTALRLPSKAKLPSPGASEQWPIGAAPSASLRSTGDASGASALAAVPNP